MRSWAEGSLWRIVEQVHEILTDNSLCHVFAGDFAVCLHGYQRNTIDVDLLVRSNEAQTVREVLESSGWKWDTNQKQLVLRFWRDPSVFAFGR